MRKENTMTVGQWCGQWFIANRPKWNGNTEGGYRNLIYGHIIPSIGSVALSDLTKQTITDFYDSLQNRGLCARSVWCVHLLLRRCMDEAAREQFIPYNPVRLCQESKAEEYKAAPLRLGQLQRYLSAAEQLGVLSMPTTTTSPRNVFLSQSRKSSRRSKTPSSVRQSACGWMSSPSRRRISVSTMSQKNSATPPTTTGHSGM